MKLSENDFFRLVGVGCTFFAFAHCFLTLRAPKFHLVLSLFTLLAFPRACGASQWRLSAIPCPFLVHFFAQARLRRACAARLRGAPARRACEGPPQGGLFPSTPRSPRGYPIQPKEQFKKPYSTFEGQPHEAPVSTKVPKFGETSVFVRFRTQKGPRKLQKAPKGSKSVRFSGKKRGRRWKDRFWRKNGGRNKKVANPQNCCGRHEA